MGVNPVRFDARERGERVVEGVVEILIFFRCDLRREGKVE